MTGSPGAVSATDNRTERRALFKIIAAMAGWGTIGLFVLESGQDSFNVVFVRCVVGAVSLGLLCLIGGYFRTSGLTPRKALLAAAGGVCLVFNWVFLFKSFEQTSLTVATVVYHTQPFYVLFLGALLFRERLTKAKIGWVVLAFAGLVLTTGLWTALGDEPFSRRQVLGILNGLAAALLYALATIAAKRLKGVRPQITAFIQVLIGIPLLVPFVQFSALPEASSSAWLWLVALGVFHTGVLYNLMYSALPSLPSSTIAVVAFVNPAVAILTDVVAYGHRPSIGEVVGIILIVLSSLGVTLNWRPWQRSTVAPPVAAAAEPPVAPAAAPPVIPTVTESRSGS
ncbi:DMT family transporter [Couchioplanes azureus]|uniref:DMT family transporter n=1 Tax=Couchioplanes caeruleus TaxID=56438 RepID=UPI00167147E5|nr:DMT family transporter [Couchioplanes caeruleus]GGQ69836.1 hypothetical protein GCM10010166_44580 [Couchioplanes caeruleus subsp. azureus]